MKIINLIFKEDLFMRSKFQMLYCVIVCVVMFISVLAGTGVSAEKKEPIQMAILLDTSSSMDGLIGQAKSQLWKIVNELATAKRNGKTPSLEVALYEYGKSSIPAQEGYIRMILPFTGDLDSVSEKLFALTTNGGDEYCGMVIESAIKNLQWNGSNDILKIIFIAGNEPFTQGTVDYVTACKNAASKGIIVNTIFCGNHKEGIDTKWKHGADLADGKYINIDQNQTVAHIDAPQDKEIARLGAELNKTYIAYGIGGAEKKERQAKQDMNASEVGAGAIVQRSLAKASMQYDNSGWDLVDAAKNKRVEVDKLEKEQLPAEMKNMSAAERKDYVDKMMKKRDDTQKKINQLNEDRRKYVANEMKKQSKTNTLDTAIINSIRDQAARKNYKFQ